MSKRQKWLWGIVFCLLFLLSQDYLLVHWPSSTGLGGFPIWLPWFMFVHALFIGVFYYFAKRYWK